MILGESNVDGHSYRRAVYVKEMMKGHTKPTEAKCVALCLLGTVAIKLKSMSNMEE